MSSTVNTQHLINRRIWILVVVVGFYLLPSLSLAQPQMLALAPMEFGAVGRTADDDFTQLLVAVQRTVPVAFLLPQVTPESYFLALRLAAGIRFDDAGDARFRYQVTGLSLEMQKSPWAARFTLVDADARGLDDLYADWIGLRVGPGFSAGSEHYRLVVRGLVGGSVNTFEFGSGTYPDLGRSADDARTGLAYGVYAHAALTYRQKVILQGDIGRGRHSTDSGMRRNTVRLSASWKVDPRWSILGRFDSEETSLGGASPLRTGFSLGLSFSPNASDL